MARRRSFLPDPTTDRLPPRQRWDARYAHFEDSGLPSQPRDFLTSWLPSLPKDGLALDIAAGAGRHSLALAQHGLRVHAVDISLEGLRRLKKSTRPPEQIVPIVLDLERGWLPHAEYDVIVNFLFLERAVFPAIKQRLKTGGWLLIETFTVEQLTLPHKAHLRRHFLLETHELADIFSDMEIVFYNEGLAYGNYTAQLVAKKK